MFRMSLLQRLYLGAELGVGQRAAITSFKKLISCLTQTRMIVSIVSLKLFWLVIIFVALFNPLSQGREISGQEHRLKKNLCKSL